MSGAELLAVLGIVSNILQVTDFCAKVTDRVVEFSGRAAKLPGSLSDLRVVLDVVKLNLRKLYARIQSTKPDAESVATLKGLVKLIQRDAETIQSHLSKLPPPEASWMRVTSRAITSVFSESKIEKATADMLRNVELLSQQVVASLPTADEIARVVEERQTAAIDKRLSVALERMKSNAAARTAVNNQTFNNHKHEHRNSSTGHAINVKGHTQIHNTYITVNMSLDEYGTQLDQAAQGSSNQLVVPGTKLPFHPLTHAISNPDLPRLQQAPRPTTSKGPTPPTGPGFVVEEEPDEDEQPMSSPRTPPHTSSQQRPPSASRRSSGPIRHSASHSVSGGRPPLSSQARLPTISGEMNGAASAYNGDVDDDAQSLGGQTVAPTVAPSFIDGASAAMTPPRTPQASSRRRSSQLSRVPSEALHNTVFELDSGYVPLPTPTSPVAPAHSVLETPSEVRTISDVWSATVVEPDVSDGTGSIISGSTAIAEDTEAINTANALIRRGAAAVTVNPSEAKRAYMTAMNTCKSMVAYSPSFSVRKFRALTLSAIGLSLCTVDRERYMAKAREYNAQAMTAACRTNDNGLVHRVRLDEADLQMKEARMFEKRAAASKSGGGGGAAGADATMRQFSAFGTYQGIVADLKDRCQVPADCNTCAQAYIGCGKMAAVLARNPGTFRTSQGSIMPPRAYFEQALAMCRLGSTIPGARQDDIALLRDTEAQAQRVLHGLP